jgi:prepilin-type N-terminal cleavage/methylation domain-containing protein
MRVNRAVPGLLADERGFSLMELLMAMVVGSIVLTSVMYLSMSGMTNSAKITDRVEATQRARVATDRITSLLQAQVCNSGIAPITEATPTSVTFTANNGDVSSVASRYRLSWDSATGSLTESRWAGSVNAAGTLVFAATPTTRVVITNAQPVSGAIFQYYAFDPATGQVNANPLPMVAGSVAAANLGLVVRVGTALTALPERTKKVGDPRSTTVTGQAIVGSADPANPDKGPNC